MLWHATALYAIWCTVCSLLLLICYLGAIRHSMICSDLLSRLHFQAQTLGFITCTSPARASAQCIVQAMSTVLNDLAPCLLSQGPRRLRSQAGRARALPHRLPGEPTTWPS